MPAVRSWKRGSAGVPRAWRPSNLTRAGAVSRILVPGRAACSGDARAPRSGLDSPGYVFGFEEVTDVE